MSTALMRLLLLDLGLGLLFSDGKDIVDAVEFEDSATYTRDVRRRWLASASMARTSSSICSSSSSAIDEIPDLRAVFCCVVSRLLVSGNEPERCWLVEVELGVGVGVGFDLVVELAGGCDSARAFLFGGA